MHAQITFLCVLLEDLHNSHGSTIALGSRVGVSFTIKMAATVSAGLENLKGEYKYRHVTLSDHLRSAVILSVRLVNGSNGAAGSLGDHSVEVGENGVDHEESDDKEDEGGVAGDEPGAGQLLRGLRYALVIIITDRSRSQEKEEEKAQEEEEWDSSSHSSIKITDLPPSCPGLQSLRESAIS